MAAEAGKPDRLSNRDVAAILANVADMLQILDANRFRIIAFQNAAEAIRTLGQDIRVVHAEESCRPYRVWARVLPTRWTSC